MKLSIKKFASLALMAAAFLLGPVLNASASSCSYPTWLKSYLSCYSRTRCSYYSSYYCNSYNYQNNCRNVCGNNYDNNNCGSGSGGTTNTPPPVVTGSISITPVGTIVGIGTTISIVAPYTAPKNSTAQVTLFEDEVPIAVYVIPATSSAGNAVFSIAVPSYLDVSVFQAQLTYTTTPTSTSGGSSSNDCHGRRHKYDDDCGRSVRHYKCGRSCDDDDDDDDTGGTPVTTVLSSEFLIVVRAGGGGGQSG